MAHMPKSRSASRATSSSRERQTRLAESFATPQQQQQQPQDIDQPDLDSTILEATSARASRRPSPPATDLAGFQREIRKEIRELRTLFAASALQDDEDDWAAHCLATIAEASASPRASTRDRHELDFLRRLFTAATEEEEQRIISERLKTLTAATLHGWTFASRLVITSGANALAFLGNFRRPHVQLRMSGDEAEAGREVEDVLDLL